MDSEWILQTIPAVRSYKNRELINYKAIQKQKCLSSQRF